MNPLVALIVDKLLDYAKEQKLPERTLEVIRDFARGFKEDPDYKAALAKMVDAARNAETEEEAYAALHDLRRLRSDS